MMLVLSSDHIHWQTHAYKIALPPVVFNSFRSSRPFHVQIVDLAAPDVSALCLIC